MISLPIVIRELSVAAKKPGTYYMRMYVVAGAILFGAYEMQVFRSFIGWGGGGNLFRTYAAVLLVYCVIVALRNSVDSISREKREGTLGLLFLTDLKSHDIVLGKLFAIGLHSFYGFLAVFPILGISILLGGVTGIEFVRTSAAILNVLFVIHSLGLACSTFCREIRYSYLLATFFCLLFFGVPYGLKMVFDLLSWSTVADHVWFFSPAYSFFNTIPSIPGEDHFWGSWWLSHALGWMLLGGACLYLPLSWQEGANRRVVTYWDRFKQWCYGNHQQRARFRLSIIDQNPFYWLVSRSRVGPQFVWVVVGCVTLGIMVGAIWGKQWLGAYWNSAKAPFLLGSICFLHTVLKVWIASESIRHFELQRRGGFLELLLACTPLKISEIIYGHWLALQRQFFAPVLTVLLLDTILFFANNDAAGSYIPPILGAMMVMLCADCVSIAWVGMWTAISTQKTGFAFGKTFWRILVFPWLVFLLVGTGIAFVTGRLGTVMLGWTILGLVNAIYFGVQAEHGLTRHFRLLASMQNTKPSFWRQFNPFDSKFY